MNLLILNNKNAAERFVEHQAITQHNSVLKLFEILNISWYFYNCSSICYILK